jgi:serine phosphatase RsbU (regulator of sigma subunit)
MASVAGDFYDFLIIDEKHSGYLIADVSGHGISAALIASMVKIAIQSAIHIAESPERVLKHLAEIMSKQLRSQFITAAYLFIDLSSYKARYSTAGHPLYFIGTPGKKK